MGRIANEPEKPNRTRRIVYVICEGLTESRYIGNFGRNNRGSGKFEFEILDKECFDRDLSEREQLVRMIRGHVELKTRGRYTPFRYVTSVFLSSWRNEWERRE